MSSAATGHYLAAELQEALDDPRRGEWGGSGAFPGARMKPSTAYAPESGDPLVQCDGGDGWGCFIPHAHCVCQDEGTPTRRRASLLNRNPRPEDKWK